MIQAFTSRINAWFPPIYKDGEGIGYSFNVFIRRMAITGCGGILVCCFALDMPLYFSHPLFLR